MIAESIEYTYVANSKPSNGGRNAGGIVGEMVIGPQQRFSERRNRTIGLKWTQGVYT